jgi:RNA polymerase sigma factor (sigma-70 family)
MAIRPTSSRRAAGVDGKADDELVVLARSGDTTAIDELYRRHAGAARRTARAILGSRQDAEDVVADAFLGVLRAIDGGAGPRDNFRAYLLACVRNGCKMTWRARRPVPRDPVQLDDGSFVVEDPERYVEAGIVAAAFSSLSPCWQQTLWLTAVEGKGTDEVARQLRRSPSAVPALALRAREAFAEAYLTQHVARAATEGCRRVAPKLAAYVRDHIGEGDRLRVDAHLAECAACCEAADGLRDVNSCLRSLVLPAGALATGIAGAAGGAAVAGAVSVGAAGTGVSSAGLGVLLVKIAAVAALAGPVVAYETSHPALGAPAPVSASADAHASGAGDGALSVAAGASAAGGTSSGEAPAGDEPLPSGGGGSDGGSPPVPPPPASTPSDPGVVGDVPLVGDLTGGSGTSGSLSVNTDRGSSFSTSLPLPVTIGAVVASDPAFSVVGVGGAAFGVGVGAVTVVGPEDLAFAGSAALPGGFGDVGIAATVGEGGITVSVPAAVGSDVPVMEVPVPLVLAPVAAPVLELVIDPVLGPALGLAGDLLVNG